MDSLENQLKAVHDEATFIAFLNRLSQDYTEKNDEWENKCIDMFLESSAAWAKSSTGGLIFYKKSENPWKRCAEIIYMGKLYE